MPQTYQQLKKTWYLELQKQGFEDIEDDNGNLKEWHFHMFRRFHSPVKYKTKLDYYIMAEHFLNSHKFSNKKERLIWRLHTEAYSMRDIASLTSFNKDKVNKIILHLAFIMMRGY